MEPDGLLQCWSLSSATFSHPDSLRSILISFPIYMTRSFKQSLSFRSPHQNPVCIPSLSLSLSPASQHTLSISCSFAQPHMVRVPFIKFSLCSFLLFPSPYIEILPPVSHSWTPSHYITSSTWETKFQTHKQQSKLQFLTFTCSCFPITYSKREDSELSGSKQYPNLIWS